MKINLAANLHNQNPEDYSNSIKALDADSQDLKFLENYVQHCASFKEKFSKSAQVVREINFNLTFQHTDFEQVKILDTDSKKSIHIVTNRARSDYYEMLINRVNSLLDQIRNEMYSFFFSV